MCYADGTLLTKKHSCIKSFCRFLSNIFEKTFIGTEQIPPSPSTTELQTVVVSIRNSITFFQWFSINVIVLCHSVQFHLNCLLSYPITVDTALFQPIIMYGLAFLSSWEIGYKVYEMSFRFFVCGWSAQMENKRCESFMMTAPLGTSGLFAKRAVVRCLP